MYGDTFHYYEDKNYKNGNTCFLELGYMDEIKLLKFTSSTEKKIYKLMKNGVKLIAKKEGIEIYAFTYDINQAYIDEWNNPDN